MSTPTPPPWTAQVRHEFQADLFAEDKLKEVVILGPEKDDGWSPVLAVLHATRAVPDEAVIANGHAMAQAPALLAVCERLLAAVNNEDFSEYAETLELIKETVAKAKGEVKP